MAKSFLSAVAALVAMTAGAALGQVFQLRVQAAAVAEEDPFGAAVPAESSVLAAGGETTPALGDHPRIEMVNGDYYTGALLDGDKSDVLVWQSEAATTPFEFSLDAVSAAHFPREGQTPRAEGDFCVELVGGDVLFGALAAISDEFVEIETVPFGLLRIERSQVRRLQRWGEASGIEYLGPDGLAGWTMSGAAVAWRAEAGHIVAEESGAVTLTECPLPQQASIEIELSWKHKADFSLAFGTAGADLGAVLEAARDAFGNQPRLEGGPQQPGGDAPEFELSVWSGSLVLVREGKEDADLAAVQKLPVGAGRLSLQLYFDQAKGEVAAYSIDGRLLARVKVADEPGGLNFGVRLTNKRGDVRLERLLVRRWTGAAPTEVPADRPYVQSADGSMQFAENLSFDAEANEVVVPPQGDDAVGEDVRIPIADVASIALPNAAEWRPVAIRAAFHDGVRLSGALAGVADGKLRLVRPGVAEPLELSVTELQSLVALQPAAPPGPPGAGEGRLETLGLRSRGRLADAEADDGASCLAWQPHGSKTSARLRTDLSGKITYREAPPPVQQPQNVVQMRQARPAGIWGAFGITIDGPVPEVQVGGAPDSGNHLLWLRAGDRIPCRLLSIDDRGVTFETDLVEATFLPHSAIKAWDLVAGSQPRELDETKFARLMTLPRMQRDNPPTHLIESVGGDFLRGRLESLSDETLTIEVRLEMKRIPRDRITRIIWLAEDESEPPADASDVERPAAMRVQAVRSDGVRLTFDPQRFEGDVLSGASELLGACQTPVTQIDQLLLNGAIAEAASELAYAKWRLLAAADPRFVTEDAATPGDEPQPGVESSLVGKPAPLLRLGTLDGEEFHLEGLRGKVVVIDFWATWCGWCMQSMPEIAAMAAEFDDDKVVLMPVNLQEDRTAVAAALERLGLEPHTALDVDGVAAARFAVTAIPQTVVIGPDGNVTHVFVGGGPGVVDQLRNAIRAALGEETEPAEGDAEATEVPAAAGE